MWKSKLLRLSGNKDLFDVFEVIEHYKKYLLNIFLVQLSVL